MTQIERVGTTREKEGEKVACGLVCGEESNIHQHFYAGDKRIIVTVKK